MLVVFALATSGLAFLFQTAPAPEKPRLREIIQAQHQAYLQTLLDGDAEAYAQMFSEDGILLFPGNFLKGQSNLKRHQEKVLAQVQVVDGSIHTLSLEVSGNLAYEIGRFHYSLISKKDDGKFNLSGRFLVIWKKVANGQWRIAVDSGFPDPPNRDR